MSVRVGILGSFIAFFLVGCSLSPEQISIREAIQQGVSDRETLATEQGKIQSAVSLDEAIARAIKYNRSRRVQLMESVISKNQLELSHFDMLPSLAATAGYNHRSRYSASASTTFSDGSPDPLDANPTYSVGSDKSSENQSLSITWNVLDFGLSYVRAEQQGDQLLIARERERKALNNLIQDVRSAYWRAVSSQRLLDKVYPLQTRVGKALKRSR
ncbi:MAG TPA: TolC family protein, partial [Gammaproteobacteria bacterium]|nr:TolC family protein [Gammaproteobacteria bacterium]